MNSKSLARLVVIAAALFLPALASAQEAAISGTVSDTTGGVLPGVVIRAVHVATGNSFEAVTDGGGAFRIPVRVGVYEITAELSGFSTVTRRGLELLVGQQVSINLQLAPSTIQETVTVTGEAPLIETTSSTMSANIDPRQMTELPINGRNWQDLLAVAPGARYNSQQRGDSVSAGEGTFQLNIDGQQVTQTFAGSGSGFGQPRFSQDAIAEVEFVSNRFDATQGRSMGVQVNAITKSGTNSLAATFAGFFRDDSMAAKDHVANEVLPYSNQQLSTTVGGPILRDRLHYFFSAEYEREPYSSFYNTPVPAFNLTATETRTEKKGLLRLDGQFSPQTRLSLRGSIARPYVPNESLHGSGTATPNGAVTNDQKSQQLQATLTRVIGNRAVNELRLGFNHYSWLRHTQTAYGPTQFLSRLVPDYVSQFTSLMAPHPLTVNYVVNFQGLSNGGSGQPQTFSQEDHSLRNDLTTSFTAKGRHDIKTGGEVFSTHHWGYVCQNCVGTIDATNGPMPSPAAMAAIFPDLYDVSTWRLDLIPTSIIRRFQQAIGPINEDVPRWDYALWFQDDWKVGQRLTLNLGVRYDRATNANANDTEILPFLPADRGDDTDNWAPRFGFAYSLTPETVIRGGVGKYFAEIPSIQTLRTVRAGHLAVVVINNDGRPDFATNPYNGTAPQTYEEALRIVRERNLQTNLSGLVANPSLVPYSYQSSIGVQHQLATSMAVQADYVFRGVRDDMASRNLNLSYDPATGVNYPNTDRTRLPYPQFSTVGQLFPDGYSNYHALQTAITRRLSNSWQASGTYTLAFFRDGYTSPAPEVPNLAEDLGPQYGYAVTDQRHRAVFNGIWQTRYGIQLSGIYFFGSGERLPTTYGGDLRRAGGNGNQLRPNGTLVARNDFVGKPIHRVDMRVQKRVNLGPRVKLDGMFEIFNVFDHANYGAYITEESNANYGQPTQTPGLNFGPRMLQLGFRATF
jgi:Carboxypeptidase regulatory-like domain/TonB dependent receptor